MTVYELNRDQLEELKQRYYMDHVNEKPSYGELAEIDNLVSDEEVYEEYAGTDFVMDDFFCTAGQDEEDGESLSEALQRCVEDVYAIIQAGYIPFVSKYPSSTEKNVKEYIYRAIGELTRARDAARSLGY